MFASMHSVIPGIVSFPYTTLFRSPQRPKLLVQCKHASPFVGVRGTFRQQGIEQDARRRILCTQLRHNRPDAAEYIVRDRKSTRLNSSHVSISYAVFCLKKNKLYVL